MLMVGLRHCNRDEYSPGAVQKLALRSHAEARASQLGSQSLPHGGLTRLMKWSLHKEALAVVR
jgi:hypothetical protein